MYLRFGDSKNRCTLGLVILRIDVLFGLVWKKLMTCWKLEFQNKCIWSQLFQLSMLNEVHTSQTNVFCFCTYRNQCFCAAVKVGWQKSMELEARARLELMIHPYFIHWFFFGNQNFVQCSWRLALHWFSAVLRPGVDLILGIGNWNQHLMLTTRGFNVAGGCSCIVKLEIQKQNQCRIYS